MNLTSPLAARRKGMKYVIRVTHGGGGPVPKSRAAPAELTREADLLGFYSSRFAERCTLTFDQQGFGMHVPILRVLQTTADSV